MESLVDQDLSAKEGESAPKTGTPSVRATTPAKPATPTPPVAKAPPKPVGQVVEITPDSPVNKMRRRIVWASIAGFLTTCFLMFLRFFLPRAIFEPSSVFKVGVGSSRVDLQACKLEYSIVSPK